MHYKLFCTRIRWVSCELCCLMSWLCCKDGSEEDVQIIKTLLRSTREIQLLIHFLLFLPLAVFELRRILPATTTLDDCFLLTACGFLTNPLLMTTMTASPCNAMWLITMNKNNIANAIGVILKIFIVIRLIKVYICHGILNLDGLRAPPVSLSRERRKGHLISSWTLSSCAK